MLTIPAPREAQDFRDVVPGKISFDNPQPYHGVAKNGRRGQNCREQCRYHLGRPLPDSRCRASARQLQALVRQRATCSWALCHVQLPSDPVRVFESHVALPESLVLLHPGILDSSLGQGRGNPIEFGLVLAGDGKMIETDAQRIERIALRCPFSRSTDSNSRVSGQDDEEVWLLKGNWEPERLGVELPGAAEVSGAKRDMVYTGCLDLDSHGWIPLMARVRDEGTLGSNDSLAPPNKRFKLPGAHK